MQKQQYLNKLGLRIKQIRTEMGINQAQLAYKCGKDPQSLERVENGKTNPSAYYLYEISRALDIPLSELMDIK